MTRLLLLAALLAAPLVQAQTRIAPNGLAGTETVFAIDADGDRLVIGVPEADGGKGAVYIAERTDDPAQPWRIGVRVVRPNGEAGDAFGSGVSVVGNDLFISAPGVRIPNPQGGFTTTGQIVYFRFNPGVQAWLQQTAFGPDDTGRLFGTAIAANGDGIVVIQDATSGNAAHVFEQVDAINWSRSITLTAPVSNSEYGSALAMDDTTLVVGAPRAGDGQAYVYDYDDARDAWGLTATLSRGGVSTPGGGIGRTRGAFSTFGASVAIDSTIIAVGAPTDVDRSMFTGGVVAFEKAASGWRRSRALYGSGGVNNGRLGESVAVEGFRVVAGAPGEGDGAAYVFDASQAKSASAPLFWSETGRLTQVAGTVGDFGEAVAIAASEPAVLAPQDLAVLVFADLAVSTDADPEADLRLSAPSPNPASGRAALTLHVDAPQHVRAVLVDALGRTVRTLLDGAVATEAVLAIEAGDLAPGVYVVQVTGERFAAAQTLTVVR